jgi:hypothetical protein
MVLTNFVGEFGEDGVVVGALTHALGDCFGEVHRLVDPELLG